MELTHFGHSCLMASVPGTAVLFDPGNFSHGFDGLTGLAAILVTHQHHDHADPDRLPALVEANPHAALYADRQTAALYGPPWQALRPGDALDIGAFHVRAVGGLHGVIHPDLPVVDNISFLVGDGEHPAKLMHPGDALFNPGEPVVVLGTPVGGPWMNIAESVNFLRAVAPEHAVPIHHGMVDPSARGIYYGRLTEFTDIDLRPLEVEQSAVF
ncbi:MBL fold metallo-hydrolase [Mycolicibacterium vaccae]|uniref:MBL fold metallo-hydrolase n=1 Tax=Mycolicibacterium vaccae TaxID=1810 RepID=UPI003CFAEE12